MDNKKIYEEAEMEMIELEAEDIITTSIIPGESDPDELPPL